MRKFRYLLLLSILMSLQVYGQNPDGIDPSAAQDSGTTNELIWNIVIFGVIPVALILIYIFWRKNKKG